jgi:hypothetical protein
MAFYQAGATAHVSQTDDTENRTAIQSTFRHSGGAGRMSSPGLVLLLLKEDTFLRSIARSFF